MMQNDVEMNDKEAEDESGLAHLKATLNLLWIGILEIKLILII